MTIQTVYIAGPMTGIPQFNFPEFDDAALVLRADGYTVVSPAEMDDPETRRAAMDSPDGAPGSGSSNGETWGDFLARDVKLIADGGIDAIVVLEGWERSKGARLETFVAYLKGLPILQIDGPREVPDLVLVARLDLFRAWTQEADLYVYVTPFRPQAIPGPR
jgi:hypothetical protein